MIKNILNYLGANYSGLICAYRRTGRKEERRFKSTTSRGTFRWDLNSGEESFKPCFMFPT